jgi:hypothetical protein
MMALGLFPYILALGAKWNIVAFITGVSHEKLQVYHQWLSHLFSAFCFSSFSGAMLTFLSFVAVVLSLCHTFPFVVQGLHEVRSNADGLNPHGYSQLYYSCSS